MKYNSEEEIALLSMFGIGHQEATKASKHIGLGVPKVAFASGFSVAIKRLFDKGLLSIEDLKEFMEDNPPEPDLYEKVEKA